MRTARFRTRGRIAVCILACLLAALAASCGKRGREMGIAEEYPPTDEAAVTSRLIELAKQALEERHASGKTLRFNQARHPGCVRADFAVEAGLPADLSVGLFAESRSYPTWIRFATASTSSDTEEDFRGMSLKVMGVEGEKLHGDGANFDFVLNSHPVLFVGTPEEFAKFIDRSLNSSPILFFLHPFDLHLKELGIVREGRWHHPSHLDISYWSTTPYLFGAERAVKYQARPCGGAVTEPHDEPTDNYLHEALRERLAGEDACFDFMIQFQTDAEEMPVEDATVEWDESVSPFRKVATVRIPAQEFDSPEQMEFCENLAFNPWHSLAEHRPIGGLNRVRKALYSELARFRHERNGVSYSEPTGDERF